MFSFPKYFFRGGAGIIRRPPVAVMTVCNVNGVLYQVDYGYQIWAINKVGGWFVIGGIVNFALSNNRCSDGRNALFGGVAVTVVR